MSYASRSLARLAVAGALLGTALAAAAQTQYTMVNLGQPASNNTFVWSTGMSDSGDYVVGRGYAASSSVAHTAYLWNETTGMSALAPAAGFTHNWAFAVNNSGTVVGNASTGVSLVSGNTAYAASTPVVWKNGAPTVLASEGRVYGINNSGIAVGSTGAIGTSAQRATIFDTNTGTVTNILATTADGLSMSSASGINDVGLIIGTGTRNTAAGGVTVALAYDSLAGTMSLIQDAPGVNVAVGAQSAYSITAADVNNNGVVVGGLGDGQGTTGYTWSAASGYSNLGAQGGINRTGILAMNDAGDMVGWGRVGANNVAFLWSNGTFQPLKDLIVDTSAFNYDAGSVFNITGIANDGTISGYATFTSGGTRAFALLPVPEPSTYAMFLAGMGVLAWVRRRRA